MNPAISAPEVHTSGISSSELTAVISTTRRRSLTRAVIDRILFGDHPFASRAQSVFQRMIGGPREVTFTLRAGLMSGLRFTCRSSNRYFILRDDYERDVMDSLSAMVRPGMVVYEVGAHYGFWALALSRMCGPGGRVFAFEPSRNNARILRTNVSQCSNVTVIESALSDTTGIVPFCENGSMSRVGIGNDCVGALSIDSFVRTHPAPDLLLVDVEGHAGSVLKGAVNTYRRRFVPVVCEIHNSEEECNVSSFVQSWGIRMQSKRREYPWRTSIR